MLVRGFLEKYGQVRRYIGGGGGGGGGYNRGATAAVATAAVAALWWVGAVAVAVAVTVARVSPSFPCAPASALLPIPFFKSRN